MANPEDNKKAAMAFYDLMFNQKRVEFKRAIAEGFSVPASKAVRGLARGAVA